jgi:hypothetical protein
MAEQPASPYALGPEGRSVECKKTHEKCHSPTTDSYCDKPEGHGPPCHCHECGKTF